MTTTETWLQIWTPWGTSQQVTQIGQGLVEVTTASHGGISVDPLLNVHVHHAWRDRSGWYEQDAAAMAVVLTFPNRFDPERVIEAHAIAKNWLPDEYEQVFRVPVLDGESYIRRSQRRRDAAAAAV